MDKSRVYLAAAAPIRRAGDGSTRRVDHSDSLSSRGGGGYARKEKRTAIEIHLDRPPARNYVRLVALWSPAAVLTSNERTNVAPFITGTSTETPDTVYCSPPLLLQLVTGCTAVLIYNASMCNQHQNALRLTKSPNIMKLIVKKSNSDMLKMASSGSNGI